MNPPTFFLLTGEGPLRSYTAFQSTAAFQGVGAKPAFEALLKRKPANEPVPRVILPDGSV